MAEEHAEINIADSDFLLSDVSETKYVEYFLAPSRWTELIRYSSHFSYNRQLKRKSASCYIHFEM